jgi:gluconate 2-dehydrogenase gamma chain
LFEPPHDFSSAVSSTLSRYPGLEETVADSKDSGKLNRRALLLGAAFLAGGAGALMQVLREPAEGEGDKADALNSEQFALLEQIADIIIPDTDTPGAIAAGVPAVIRDMLNEWASAQTRREFTALLADIDKRAWQKHGAGFLALGPDDRLALMKAIDEELITAVDMNYRRMKFLVLVGYYHSEVGATVELRYELVPGAWRPCLPLSEVGRASAT